MCSLFAFCLGGVVVGGLLKWCCGVLCHVWLWCFVLGCFVCLFVLGSVFFFFGWLGCGFGRVSIGLGFGSCGFCIGVFVCCVVACVGFGGWFVW